MILTYLETTSDGGVVIMSRAVVCPFCGPLAIPHNWGADAAYRWLEFEHLPVHVEEIADYLPEPETCARCKRVPLEGGPPHRACYLADCECPCSYPAQPTDHTPADRPEGPDRRIRFEEAE